ncbi:hypothetical protein BMH32_08305 [Leucobacter sp. OLJS4]|nr:hypothetical protein BMH25_10470 [Leucobacter sp. OLCALW19]PII87515.1 hypothetical protein BMH26_10345 [Leucobacter sp. OLTLW20]PII94427.1 hypothetical protein BMH27_00055 [Leucobacter sp. OLAS13]PIJ00773.1 hypothetical protein BMH29_01460 [Leucobacter sp. OLDS2]PIJ00832.1 hypothetical protein BMH28_08790 [Leucobacter sp. OLCS4]PIJ03407.1 hypothetical protein BMH31_08040 [Leucobacter sp. OLIS6]PIJ10739.1 hypothetical protein BMH32_08305 [Leucobacter sp. OLJS4]PIJ53520.1 hypothetical prote
MDVVAIDRTATKVIDLEVKAHYEGDTIPTTPKLHSRGVEAVAEQIALRQEAFESGVPVCLDGAPLALRKEADFLGLAVTLHDYSGLIWKAEPKSPGKAVNIITIGDLAVITTVLKDDAELIAYLELRTAYIASGRSYVCDEIDFLAHFLLYGPKQLRSEISQVPEDGRLMVPARDILPALAAVMQVPAPGIGRAVIATLPEVGIF